MILMILMILVAVNKTPNVQAHLARGRPRRRSLARGLGAWAAGVS